jgi:hypothetical protein
LARQKDKSETEHLRGELKEAQKIIKVLKKRLRTLEKSKHVWDQYNLDADENSAPDFTDIKTTPCPDCHTGTVLKIDLGIKVIESCSICQWRRVVK